MKKFIIPVLIVILLSGCAYSSHNNYQKQSKEEIEAIYLCGMGYRMENGVYIGEIEGEIYKDGIISSVEEEILSLYKNCINRLLN